MLTKDIENYVCNLKLEFPSITKVWLLGSRANGTETDFSDWDFLVFSEAPIYEEIKRDTKLHREDVDLLLVDGEEGEFLNPFGRTEKGGSLTNWKWNEVSDELANYEGTKFVSDGEGMVDGMEGGTSVCQTLKAYRVA